MATRRKSDLIHCDNCGEYYSSSYRRCPFCDEYEEEYDPYDDNAADAPSARGGGKRLDQSRRGGGYTRTSPLKIISIVISLAIILFAAWIVVTKIVPLVQRGNVAPVDPDTSQTDDGDADPSPDAADPDPDAADPGDGDPVTDPSDVTPVPDPSPAVDSGGATGFTLSKSDFSFNDQWPQPITLTVTFTPAGSTGTVTWTSSDPDVASVDANGTVSHGSKRGTATITATLSNGVTQTCIARNQVTSSTASSGSGGSTGTASGTYTVNNADFTFYSASESYKLKVNNYTGSVSWSSSNTGIATVSSDGTVTPAGSGKGSCTVTGTLDNGSTVTAIVRINIS